MSVCFPETEISNTPEQGVRLSADLYLLIWLDCSIVNLSHVTDDTILEADFVGRITFNLYIHITTS